MTQNPDPNPDPPQVLDDLLSSEQQQQQPESLSSPGRVLSIDARVEQAWAHWKKLGRPKYIVAPMVDNSELPFRLLCQKYGAQAAYTPMLHSRVFTETEKYRNQEFTTCKEDRPLFVQFCANDPDTLLEAAKRVQPYCDYVDINLGDGLIISLSLFLTFSVNGQLIPGTTSSTSISTRRKLLSAPSSRLPRISSIKCSSSRDTEAPPKDLLLKNLAKSLAVASVSSAASFFLFPISNLPSLAAETEMTVVFGEKLLSPMRNSHRTGILTAYRRTS
ncbi:hypothetical protein F2Q69_00040232 [Brassica cretica]|uniref:DUS-like FMN-binding domain-containing protein n=1 Tax=Brassica cretica TaxID=69181 RepID=A0A8S9NDR2_BRACR|nr:hypothetical protein F2Q69_00040232 [Brassica cretica]